MNLNKYKLTKKAYILLSISLVAIFILYNAIACLADWNGWGKNGENTLITIEKGANLTQVANIVKDKKIISNKTLFRYYLKKHHAEKDIKPGSFELQKNMSYKEILKVLSGAPVETGIKVIIPEGYGNRQIADLLEEKGICMASDFITSINNDSFDYSFLSGIIRTENKLEGYLFPATYTFEKNSTPHQIAEKMLSAFDANWKQEYTDRANELGWSIDKVVTLASVIEKESVGGDDMKKVSSVFWNRLKKGMALQSDATVQYILDIRNEKTFSTQIDSQYNTYKYPGLPIGPIANPGIKSIEAALYPDDTPYYFFVFYDGVTYYSKTFEEHKQAIKEHKPK